MKLARKPKAKKEQPTPEEAKQAEIRDRAEEVKAKTDELLDEIEGVLEDNAAQFIADFVQKGGQ